MYIKDEQLSSVLHSMVAIISKLKKLNHTDLAIYLERIKEELLMSIEDKDMLKEALETVISKVPIVRILPYIYGAWDKLPEDKKEEYAAIFLAAAAKGASQYVGSKS